MAQKLEQLTIKEVSLVDSPACSSVDPKTGQKTRHAIVALWKRDSDEQDLSKKEEDELTKAVNGKTQEGETFPKGDFAYTPDDVPAHWKLRLTKTPGGKPDPGITGAAAAALGEGFRGNKVIIPDSDRAAVVARVRTAWKQANPDRELTDAPSVLQKGETQTMTLEEIEKKLTDQQASLDVIKAENSFLKSERDVVLKMTKEERKAYASMDADEQKKFMSGDDATKTKMCDSALGKLKEKATEDSMEASLKAEFAKAGPSRRAQMLSDQEALLAKAAKSKKSTDNEDDSEEEDDNLELKASKKRDELELSSMKKNFAEANDRISKAETELSDFRKREKLVHFTKLAETELPNTSGTPAEKGEHLMKVASSLGEQSDVFKQYLDNLRAADKALTVHFTEVGKSGGVIPAEKALYAKVDEICKRDRTDKGHAMAKAMEEFPELYMAYEEQQRAYARSV